MARIIIEIIDNEYGEIDITMAQEIPLYNSGEGYYPYTEAEAAARKLRTALFKVLQQPDEEDEVH